MAGCSIHLLLALLVWLWPPVVADCDWEQHAFAGLPPAAAPLAPAGQGHDATRRSSASPGDNTGRGGCPRRAEQVGASLLQHSAAAVSAARAPQAAPRVEGTSQRLLLSALQEHERLREEALRASRYDLQVRREHGQALALAAQARRQVAHTQEALERLRTEDAELRRQNDRLVFQVDGSPAALPPVMLQGDNISQATGDDAAESEGRRKDVSQLRRWSYYITAAFLVVSVFSAAGYRAYLFCTCLNVDLDADGDGDWDMEDLRKDFFCGLSPKGIKNLAIVLLIGGGGFAGLWWANIIQHFLAPLTMIIFAAAMVMAILSVIIADCWDRLTSKLKVFFVLVKKLERAFAPRTPQR